METVAAVTTGPGPGAIGVIEVVGPDARTAVAALFRPRRAGANPFAGGLVLGVLTDGEQPIDEAMVCLRPAGAGWTGGEAVEIHCHGGPAVLAAAIEALERRGVRRATPVELAGRSGRLDAVQIEALEHLAAAATPLAARVLLDQFHGALSRELRRLASATDGDLASGIDALLAGAPFGLALSMPPRIVLSGAPNAGKSTLFNALVGADRALVASHPGTTRDPVDDRLAPGGVPIRLIDTAGICGNLSPSFPRPPSAHRNFIEGGFPLPEADADTAGQAAAARAAGEADAVLVVVDASAPMPAATRALADGLRQPHAWVFTKIDRVPAAGRDASHVPDTPPAFRVSAREGWGVEALAAALPGLAGIPPAPPGGAACVFAPRQRDALAAARAALPDAPRARRLLNAIPASPPDLHS